MIYKMIFQMLMLDLQILGFQVAKTRLNKSFFKNQSLNIKQ
jgi:hypothetical protein